MATLTVMGTRDYSNDTLSNITEIVWGFGIATFAPGQFDGTQIATNVNLRDTSNSIVEIDVVWSTPTGFSASGWTFTNWGSGDTIRLKGSTGADLVIGSSQNDFIYVSGQDTLSGVGGDDTFFWGGPSDLVAGTSINGGTGTDSLLVTGTLNFASVSLTSIERVRINPESTAILTPAQIANITSVVGFAFDRPESLSVTGSSVSLAHISFSGWHSIRDTVTITGTAGNDTLVGSSVVDTINPGFGADVMTGGGDDDRFIINAGSGADTITDFLAGPGSPDKVQLPSFSTIDTLGDILGRATQNGPHTFIDFGNGNSLTLNNALKLNLHFDDFIGLETTSSNFNGDGTSDLLWRGSQGEVTTWQMRGATAEANVFQASVGMDWSIATVGDFNGDGRADLAWRHASSGTFTTWQMNGFQATPNVMQAQVGLDWKLAAAGDFNGDGRDDLLWRHQHGTMSTWQMNGANPTPNVFQDFLGNDWHLTGVGDFNGDGRDDLLWRHDTGALTTWQMNGATAQRNVFFAEVGTDWNIVGVGDFNGDGRDDLLWRHDGGTIATWQMNGSAAQPNVLQAHVHNDFRVAQIGDLNGDGRDDIMWRHTSGTVTSWEMNGATAQANVFQAQVSPSFGLFSQQFDFV